MSARKPEALQAVGRSGCCPVPLDGLESCLPQVALVFNTIPAMVLTKPRLALLPPEAQVLDLASSPGGTDFAAARGMGIDAVPALGLPGKMTPGPAAAAIFHTLMQMLREES